MEQWGWADVVLAGDQLQPHRGGPLQSRFRGRSARLQAGALPAQDQGLLQHQPPARDIPRQPARGLLRLVVRRSPRQRRDLRRRRRLADLRRQQLFIVDAEVGWKFASGLYINVGAQNLFDETPDDNPWGEVAGAEYPVHSPYGFNARILVHPRGLDVLIKTCRGRCFVQTEQRPEGGGSRGPRARAYSGLDALPPPAIQSSTAASSTLPAALRRCPAPGRGRRGCRSGRPIACGHVRAAQPSSGDRLCRSTPVPAAGNGRPRCALPRHRHAGLRVHVVDRLFRRPAPCGAGRCLRPGAPNETALRGAGRCRPRDRPGKAPFRP